MIVFMKMKMNIIFIEISSYYFDMYVYLNSFVHSREFFCSTPYKFLSKILLNERALTRTDKTDKHKTPLKSLSNVF